MNTRRARALQRARDKVNAVQMPEFHSFCQEHSFVAQAKRWQCGTPNQCDEGNEAGALGSTSPLRSTKQLEQHVVVKSCLHPMPANAKTRLRLANRLSAVE